MLPRLRPRAHACSPTGPARQPEAGVVAAPGPPESSLRHGPLPTGDNPCAADVRSAIKEIQGVQQQLATLEETLRASLVTPHPHPLPPH
ncbi:hypothetical protein PG994_006951 [Apiospora phragmitis]|uniref:Uncharacterized protein n=1 Tax=Apiospora phragmitis TaxID=2905665 RepID=A0ABR1VGL1_9PEZI